MATLDPTSTHIPITPGGCTVQFMNPAPGPWQDVESLQDCLAFGLWPADSRADHLVDDHAHCSQSLHLCLCRSWEPWNRTSCRANMWKLLCRRICQITSSTENHQEVTFILWPRIMTKTCITWISLLQAHCQRSWTQSASHHWPSRYTQFFGPEPVVADTPAVCDAGRYRGCLLPIGLRATLSLCILFSNFDHIHWAHESCDRRVGWKWDLVHECSWLLWHWTLFDFDFPRTL